MASDGDEFRSTENNFVADSPPRPQPDDDRYDFGFPVMLDDHHFGLPSSDHDFEPFPWLSGRSFGEEEEAVGMRRRRGSQNGVVMDAEEDDGGGKRARVVGLDEADRGRSGVYDEADVVALEVWEDRGKFDGRNPEMSTVDYVNGNDRFGFDMNVPTVDYIGVGESLRGALDGAELGLGLTTDVRKGKNVVYVDSDSSDSDVQILDWGKFSESALKSNIGNERNLVMIDLGSLGDQGSSSQRRYTKEEKGKSILSDDWLSIATANHKLAFPEQDGKGNQKVHEAVNGRRENCIRPDVNGIRILEPEEDYTSESVAAAVLPPMEPPDKDDEPEPPMMEQSNLQDRALLTARRQAVVRRLERKRYKEIARDNASLLAHPRQLDAAESPRHEIEENTGPFSMAMQKIIEHKEGKHKPRSQPKSFTINWTPSRGQDYKLVTAKIPSLLDLSVATLARNAESVVSLEPAPDALKHKISQAACDFRKMDSHLLEIYVSESPTEVYVKDCSWMTEEQLVHIFGGFDTKRLTVLQLDLCGQALTEHTLSTTLAKNCMPSLAILSLKSACRLTDTCLASIVETAPSLQSINLSQCSLVTACGISKLANCFQSTLKELYMDDCQNIDMLSILPALMKFEHLEVFSVSGINTVSDEFVRQFICARGSNLKELVLADCQKLTDSSLKVIGQTCPQLCALDISNLSQLTDATMEYIANGCRSIQKLKFCRNSFSDEAVASFLEVSGQSLKELSLNHISKVGPYTALALAKQAKGLLYLDLSWCRKLTDAAIGLVVDSCLSLRLLKLFGCTQITELFLNGHSNPNAEIIGLKKMSILKHISAVDPQPGPLRYSPLITSELL
ncbi:unnamed protein product [Rhodiola kirilowii]